MEDPRRLAPTGRDVAAAWLICLIIGGMALGLRSALHGGVPPAATVMETASYPSPRAPGYSPSTHQPSRAAAVTAVHRLVQPTSRLPDPHPG